MLETLFLPTIIGESCFSHLYNWKEKSKRMRKRRDFRKQGKVKGKVEGKNRSIQIEQGNEINFNKMLFNLYGKNRKYIYCYFHQQKVS